MLQNVEMMYLYNPMNIYLTGISIVIFFTFAPSALPLMFVVSVNGCESALTDPQGVNGFARNPKLWHSPEPHNLHF